MNRTQKIAWFNIVLMFVWFTLIAFLAIEIFFFKEMPEGIYRYGPLIILFAVMISFLILIKKRQSPREVGSDERDKLIMNKAAMAAFVSMWIVLPAVSVIPRMLIGDVGCIPAWMIPLINFSILLIVMAVYSSAILVQYFATRNNAK